MARTRVRWGRVAILLLAAAVAVAVLVSAARASVDPGGAGSPSRSASAREYVVRSGDTVWSLARGIAGPAADPRPVVDAIVAANDGLDPRSIRPGQAILLPAGG